MQQTYGQRSRMSTGSKRSAIKSRITSEFAMCSQYQNIEQTEILVCALFEYLQKENRSAMPNLDFSCGRNTFFFGSRHCAVILFSQVPKKNTNLNQTLLYIFILGTCGKFVRKDHFLALGVSTALLERWPQVCRVKIMFTVILIIVSFPPQKKSMTCVVNWILLRIRVRFTHAQGP